MTLSELVSSIPEFSGWNFTQKVRLFAWHLHTHRGMPRFQPVDVQRCFTELSLDAPSNVRALLADLAKRKPKEVLPGKDGYCLEKGIRDEFDAKYGQRAATIAVHKLLAELPARVPNLAQREYLDEALVCFKHSAFRAAVVMAWNVAFDHLCEWVLAKHLPAFNAQLPKSYARAPISTITKRDDFYELKESQVLQVCSSAGIISTNVHRVLKEKLDRRNIAAHPSGVAIKQPTAEDCIIDLIENAVLKLV